MAATAVGTGASIYESEAARGQQEKAYQAQQNQNNLNLARQQRDSVRTARIAYANSQNTASNQGAGGGQSSAEEGGAGSIASQLGSNLSFLDQSAQYTQQASAALAGAESDRELASEASTVAGLGSKIAGASGPISASFNRMFGGGGPDSGSTAITPGNGWAAPFGG